jgi:xanthine phosphoribosyltransferase
MKKLIIKDKEFKGIVSKMCRKIATNQWQPDYVVGITRGGLLPAVMISQYFNIPCNTLNVSLRDGIECESNLWMAEDAFGYVNKEDRVYTEGDASSLNNRKNILIVDDINDSGATLNWIKQDWPGGCFPDNAKWETVWGNNVRVAVLYDNESSKCTIPIGYSAETINKFNDPQWVVFPWEEWWRRWNPDEEHK